MRVNISSTEKTKGFLLKTNFVEFSATVAFTEEELHIMKKMNLVKKVLCEKPRSQIVVKHLGSLADDPSMFELTSASLISGKPFTYNLDDHAQAAIFKNDLTEGLKLLKQHIDKNAAGSQSESFEL